ncbi:E3 ubiquitin-protein ligase rnf8 [Nasonia vitripennis]|uniref:RING-type domain-containing protein n=1 Tax=Nasonia vitripennis TaxID=7425 RepID=A0A7M7QKL8_NASVI|nr:E3 ubiquitin-protein ligase rnf8 [Nasonia vitripennis]
MYHFIFSNNNAQSTGTQKKPTDKQLVCIIDFMERHPRLANGIARASEVDENWSVLFALLHAKKGTRKTLAAWKKTWTGMVTAARQSMRFLIDGRKKSPMSPNHIRIIDIVGYNEEDSKVPLSISYEDPPCANSCKYEAPTNSWSRDRSCHEQPSTSSNWNNGLHTSRSTSNSYEQPPRTTSMNQYNAASTSSSSYQQQSRATRFDNRPSTSTAVSGSYEQPSSSIRSYNRPSTSSSTNQCWEPRLHLSLNQEPLPKRPRLGDSTTTEKNARSTAALSAAERSAKLVEKLEQKGQELVTSLANQLIGCFEKQNDVLKKGLQDLSETVVRTLPNVVATELQKALKNCNPVPNNATSQEESGTIEQLLIDEAADNDFDQVFNFIEQSVMAKKAEEGKCAICQDNITDRKQIQCNHSFCKYCIDTWLEHSRCCPVCRQKIPVDEKDLTWKDIVFDDSDDDL